MQYAGDMEMACVCRERWLEGAGCMCNCVCRVCQGWWCPVCGRAQCPAPGHLLVTSGTGHQTSCPQLLNTLASTFNTHRPHAALLPYVIPM